MATKIKKKKKTLLETVHSAAKGLYKAGIMDSTTLREFDALCLPDVKELSSKEIKKLRYRSRK